MELNRIVQGDSYELIKTIPNESVNLVITSPPYYQQRSYTDDEREIGNEDEIVHYVDRLLIMFRECLRVLKPEGSVVWNLGDKYIKSSLQLIPYRFAISASHYAKLVNNVSWVKCLSGQTSIYYLVNGTPTVSYVKDLYRNHKDNRHKIQIPSYDEYGKFCWSEVSEVVKQTGKSRMINIICEDGSEIICTSNHLFPIAQNGFVAFKEASSLNCDDVLLKIKEFDLPTTIESESHDKDLGEFIGWYLAEGSIGKVDKVVQLSMNVDEEDKANKLIEIIRAKFGVVGKVHKYGNSLHLNFNSRLIVSLVRKFVSGKNASEKRLTKYCFHYGRMFLQGLLDGYLQGDGHKEEKRWRVGFTRNKFLADGLRLVCLILGYRMRLQKGKSRIGDKRYNIFRGEIRKNGKYYSSLECLGLTPRSHFRYGQRHSLEYLIKQYKLKTRKNKDGKITDFANMVLNGNVITVAIKKITLLDGEFNCYDISMSEDSNHVFALANGVLTHNSNPTPRQFRKRLVSGHEPFFHFAKSGDYYFQMPDEVGPKKNMTNYQSNRYFDLIDKSELTDEQKLRAKKDLCKVISEVKEGTVHGFRLKIRGIHAMPFGGQEGGRKTQILTNGYTIIRIYGRKLQKDVFESAVDNIKWKKHPAVYPLNIIERFLGFLTKEDDIVLDPFMGSGTTGLACKNLKRNFVGFELCSEFVEEANKRLKI